MGIDQRYHKRELLGFWQCSISWPEWWFHEHLLCDKPVNCTYWFCILWKYQLYLIASTANFPQFLNIISLLGFLYLLCILLSSSSTSSKNWFGLFSLLRFDPKCPLYSEMLKLSLFCPSLQPPTLSSVFLACFHSSISKRNSVLGMEVVYLLLFVIHL